jgi:hypothetical protein
MCVHSCGLFELHCSTPYGLGAFNAIGDYCVLPCQGALTMWYVIAKFYHVGVLRIRVCDLGGAEWSHRRYTSSTFERVSISSTSCEHLTLAVICHSLPHEVGATGCLVCSWAYK